MVSTHGGVPFRNKEMIMRHILVLMVLFLAVPVWAKSPKADQRERLAGDVEKEEITDVVSFAAFKSEKGKFNFEVDEAERQRLHPLMAKFYENDDAKLLDRMVDAMTAGKIAVYETNHETEDGDQGVLYKAAFLMPPVAVIPYLRDKNLLDVIFDVYVSAVSFLDQGNTSFVLLQPEGTMMGFTSTAIVPVMFINPPGDDRIRFRRASQQDIKTAIAVSPVVIPGRAKPEEKFIDHMRSDWPYNVKDPDDPSSYEVEDEDLVDLLKDTLYDIDEECPVKQIGGGWDFYFDGFDDFVYVEYTLSSAVNVDALFPGIPGLQFIVKKIAQSVSDEAALKYLPVSMKNIRDFALARAAEGAVRGAVLKVEPETAIPEEGEQQ